MTPPSDTSSTVHDTISQLTPDSIATETLASPDYFFMDYGLYIASALLVIIIILLIVTAIQGRTINDLKNKIQTLKDSSNKHEPSSSQILSHTNRTNEGQKIIYIQTPSYVSRPPAPQPGMKDEAPKFKYLTTARDGSFRKPLDEPSSKTFFRMWNKGGTLQYEFHGNATKAIENLNAIFDDVCEIEGGQANAKDIKNISPGILDAQLRIQKKAIIKLI